MNSRAPVPKSAEFRAYPSLTEDEFAEACQHLDRIYRHATLGPLRRRWRLSACTTFNTNAYGNEYATFIQILRPLEDSADLSLGDGDGDLAGQLDRFSLTTPATGSADETEDAYMAEAEEADEAALPKQTPAGPPVDIGSVTYEIHLHSTYRAPCLWFSLHGLPDYEPAFDMETVFRRLVPGPFKDSLRAAGSIGGISADYHPVTGVPTFFVHPCLLGDAMAGFDCSKKSYLMIWLGLVGGCVGLWVPKEMALVEDC